MITGKPTDHIVVRSLQFIEGDSIATVDCADFEAYQKLPDALRIGDALYGKTGWSNDSNYACYKSQVNLATAAVALTLSEEVSLLKMFESYEMNVSWIPESLHKLRLLLDLRKVINS